MKIGNLFSGWPNASPLLLKPAACLGGRAIRLNIYRCLLLLMLVSGGPLALAQIETGGVTGTVKDSSGAVIVDAQVTLTNDATGVAQTTHSTSTGTYVFEAVPVGAYTIKASHPGFGDVVIQNVEVHIQFVLTEDATLQVGSTQQEVTVTSAAPLLQAESAAIGTTVESQSVVDLPLNGRDWASLAQLAAGVTTASTQFSGAPGSAYFTVDGMNPWMQDFRLDGIDDNVELYGGPGPTNSNVNITPPPDAIQEFRMQNGNFNAEFGHSSGGVINAVVRSGTNSVHGDLWEFLRNQNPDANDYFSNLYGLPKAPYHLNQFGGTIGGPVFIPKIYDGKNKTFFFFDYQGTRIIEGTANTSTVPTTLEQSSDFTNFQDLITSSSGTKSDALNRVFPYGAILDPATTRFVAPGEVDPVSGISNTSGGGIYVRDPFFNGNSVTGITDFTKYASSLNQLPAGRLDPNAVRLLQLYPSPNGAGIQNNYFSNASTVNNVNQYDVRIDESWGSHDTIFGVFDWSHYHSDVPNRLPGIADGGNYSTGTIKIPVYSIAVGDTHTFTPTLSDDFHIGYDRNLSQQLSSSANTPGLPAQYGITGVAQFPDGGGLPSFSIGGLTNLGPALYMPNIGTIESLEIMDNVTKVHGSHTFKAGVQLDHLYGIVTAVCCFRGGFNYTGQYSDVVNGNTNQLGMSDMLITAGAATVPGGIGNLGSMSSLQVSNYAANRDLRYYTGAFFQDDWKVTPTLTLNLGLRWDHYSPYEEINGRQANFIQSGDGNGPTGTYYIPKEGCQVPRAAAFDALLATSNISIDCTSNKATGNSQSLNFSPRIGFAERVLPSLVVRGGYGIAFGALSNIGFGPTLGVNYPFIYDNTFNSANAYTPFLNPSGQVATLETALASVNVQDPAAVTPSGLNLMGRQYNFHTPYTQTYNLTVQDQVSQHDSIQAGYIGVLGRQLDGLGYHNSPDEILPVGANIYNYIPFPSFAPNSPYEVTNGTSSYNSLQATYQHQTSFGLNLLANWTWSKCMSDQAFYATTFGNWRALWLPGYGAKGDYSLCDSDSTHVVHISGEYQLPVGRNGMYLKHINAATNAVIGGWALNYIYTFQGGEPFPVYCATSTTADFGCYADQVSGQSLYAGGKTQQEWLNPNAWVNPPQATAVGQTDYSPLGGRVMVARGPHFNNLDASLFKQFAITEIGRLEFRAEAFNLTNTAQFGQPGNTGGFENPGPNNANGFSAITGLRNNPRLMQFALKLYY